jgi:peptide/nickel transport system permease protein
MSGSTSSAVTDIREQGTVLAPDAGAPIVRRRTAVRRAVAERALSLVVTIVLAAVLIFVLTSVVPGDVASVIAGPDAPPERVESIRQELGLDKPLTTQFGTYMSDLARGDLGRSMITGESVVDAVLRTYSRTLHIAVGGLVIAILLGVSLGIVAALRAGTASDGLIRTVSTAGLAIPGFWLGLILVAVFALELGWFPATGFVGITEDPLQSIRHLALPSFTVAVATMSAITRQTRSSMLEVISADFVRTLRAVGIREASVICRHALKNAAIPIVTIIGLDITSIIGGTIVIETVFGISGVGGLTVEAALLRDFPLVRGTVLIVVFVVVVTNMLIDVLYAWLDPRIRRPSA